MNRKEFAKILADKYDIAQALACDMCDAVFNTLSEELDKGEDVYIYNLGTFKQNLKKAKNVRHPITGEMMTIPERKVVSFKRAQNKREQNED